MSVERLAAACLLPGFEGVVVPVWLRRWIDDGLGGVVLFSHNVESPEQLAALTGGLRGLVVAIDEEGGDVTRLEHERGSSYPGNFALGAVDDVALTEEVGAAIGADLAAVALAKFRFTGQKLFIVLMIGIQMLPQAGLIIPLFVVLRRYGQVNTLTGVIFTYMTFVLPFSVWTLRGFLLGIPRELEEAAMVDGSSRLGAFVKILLPLVAPGLVATSIFAFITSWNEYIFARILLNDGAKQTATVWLSYFTGTSRHTDWGGLMAGSTLVAIPVVIFFLLVQRKIAFGLTAGAVKA